MKKGFVAWLLLVVLFLAGIPFTLVHADNEALNDKSLIAGVTNDSNKYVTFVRVDPSTKLLLAQLAASTAVIGHVIVDSTGLPTGAATAALQTTGNAILTTINAFASTIATNSATQATAAKQDTGNTSLSSIDGKITAVNTGAVVVSSSALPTGASTEATLVTLAGYMAPWTPYVSNVDAVDATIKGTPGSVGFVTIVAAAGIGSTLVLKNGGAGGTALATIDATVVGTTEFNVAYGTDIYVDNTAAGGGGGSYVVGYH